MKTFLYISLLFILGSASGPLEEANALFEAKDYGAALTQYQSVLTTYPDQSHEIYFNIGQCYMAMDSIQQALTAYYQALSPDHERTSSLAYNQIGIIFAQGQQYQQALTSFQKAVRLNSLHLEAAYNYELIRRIMEGGQDPNEQQQEQQEEGQEQSNDEEGDQQQEEQDGESEEDADEEREEEEKKEPQDATTNNEAQQPANNDQAKPFSTDTLDMDRARQLLDRMRENEMRFMQELRKRTKKKEKTGKPDW